MRRPATKKAPGVKQSETAIHLEVMRFLRLAWPGDLPVFHVPNGGSRTAREAGKLKAMGVLAGVPDLTFILPNGQTAFIELKTSDGGLSAEQIDFRTLVVALGCAYRVCRTVDEVEATITRWLAAFGRAPLARLTERVAA